MKKILLSILFATVCAIMAHAQTYIFNDCINRPAYGDSLAGMITQYDTIGVDPVSAGGANLTWDFSAMTSNNTIPILRQYLSPSVSIDTANDYPDANLMVLDNGDYLYYRYSPDSLTYHGDYQSDYKFRIAWDPKKNQKCPMDFGNTYSDFYSSHTSTLTCPYYHSYYTRTVTYDAYGTLKLPSASYVGAARIKVVETNLDSGMCVPITATITNNIYYTWFDKTNGQPILGMHYYIDSTYNYYNHFIESYSYSHLPAVVAEGVASLDGKKEEINVFPNPSDGKITITSDNAYAVKGELKIYDVLGNVVYQKPSFEIPASGNSTLHINLSSGMYFIRINSSKTVLDKKIAIE